jgi:hypothetical protein
LGSLHLPVKCIVCVHGTPALLCPSDWHLHSSIVIRSHTVTRGNSPKLNTTHNPPWVGSDSRSLGQLGWWFGLAPATLECWVRFPNERNQGKQAHPVLKNRVPHGSQGLARESSSLVAHVLHYPLPPNANSFVIGTAVINTHAHTIPQPGLRRPSLS